MKKALIFILASLTIISLCRISLAAEPLPMQQAFRLTTRVIDPNTLLVHWTITPGYFLYRDKLHFKLNQQDHAKLGKILLPSGQNKTDEHVGTFQVFYNEIDIPVRLLGVKPGQTELIVSYQGCADSGFCYPPSEKTLTLTIDNSLGLSAVTISKEDSVKTAVDSVDDQANHILATKNLWLILVSFFGFGLLLSFTPCVLPMIPVLSGIIIGQGKHITTAKAFTLSLIYVLSMSITYAIAGIIVALVGSNLQAALQNPWAIASFSALFVLLALAMFGFYDLRLPDKFEAKIANISRKQRSGAYISAAIMGCLATLILSPCVTAPLVGALTYIAQTGNVVLGASALFTLSLGMGVPLLLIGTSAGKLLPKAGMWMNAVERFFGVLLLGVAIYLLSRIIPGQLSMVLWSALLIVSAIFMGALQRMPSNHWQKLWQGIGIILLTYGILLLIGAALDNTDPLRPLAGLSQSTQTITDKQSDSTQRVNTIADVKKAVQQASAQGRPVFLDFYADWCLSCKIMEKTIFTNPAVKKLLQQFVILKADITANSATDKALSHYFSVIAPPTFIFFNTQGQEVKAARIVGEVDAKQFLQHARRALR